MAQCNRQLRYLYSLDLYCFPGCFNFTNSPLQLTVTMATTKKNAASSKFKKSNHHLLRHQQQIARAVATLPLLTVVLTSKTTRRHILFLSESTLCWHIKLAGAITGLTGGRKEIFPKVKSRWVKEGCCSKGHRPLPLLRYDMSQSKNPKYTSNTFFPKIFVILRGSYHVGVHLSAH